MKRTNYDGYWNMSNNPTDSECWFVWGTKIEYVKFDGSRKKSLVDMAEGREKIDSGRWVPSEWLPPGVKHNPADKYPAAGHKPEHAKDVNPIKAEHQESARRFVMIQAMAVLTNITLNLTPKANEAIRYVYPHPSMLDRAIAERVLALLS